MRSRPASLSVSVALPLLTSVVPAPLLVSVAPALLNSCVPEPLLVSFAPDAFTSVPPSLFVSSAPAALASVVPELTANYRIPTFIFMLNNPTGSSDLAQALGRDRVLLGFPGAGGTRDGHVVRYAMIAQQPTTLGELAGRRTARVASPDGLRRHFHRRTVFPRSAFPARLRLNAAGIVWPGVRVLGTSYPANSIQGLFGRDLLDDCVFIYDGKHRSFTLDI